jgi:hypothetical protein
MVLFEDFPFYFYFNGDITYSLNNAASNVFVSYRIFIRNARSDMATLSNRREPSPTMRLTRAPVATLQGHLTLIAGAK